jgi:hypothetical protein
MTCKFHNTIKTQKVYTKLYSILNINFKNQTPMQLMLQRACIHVRNLYL